MGLCFSSPHIQKADTSSPRRERNYRVSNREAKHGDFVIFFPDKGMPCRFVLEGRECRRRDCSYIHSKTGLVELLQILNAARRYLDICVFTITCNEIAAAIIAAHRRGVKVRVISDDDQSSTKGSDISELRQCGIPVRLDNSEFHMHHKFALIDQHRLITGSFNWTRQAVTSNQENLVVLHSPDLISQFSAEFEKLWNAFR